MLACAHRLSEAALPASVAVAPTHNEAAPHLYSPTVGWLLKHQPHRCALLAAAVLCLAHAQGVVECSHAVCFAVYASQSSTSYHAFCLLMRQRLSLCSVRWLSRRLPSVRLRSGCVYMCLSSSVVVVQLSCLVPFRFLSPWSPHVLTDCRFFRAAVCLHSRNNNQVHQPSCHREWVAVGCPGVVCVCAVCGGAVCTQGVLCGSCETRGAPAGAGVLRSAARRGRHPH